MSEGAQYTKIQNWLSGTTPAQQMIDESDEDSEVEPANNVSFEGEELDESSDDSIVESNKFMITKYNSKK